MKFGFLGLGIMGGPMATNLLKAGHQLVVWNRSSDKCGPLVELGAEAKQCPAEVVADCDVTFAMLADPAAVEAVCLGPDGALDGMAPGKGYVDMSTIDPATSIDMKNAITDCGGRYLEAPVSGSKQPAEMGELVILAAGSESLYREVGPALDIMGKKRVFLGYVGQAARMKLIVNMVMGGMMTAFSEGLGLTKNCGLNSRDLLAILEAGAMANPMFAGKGPAMAEGKFTPAFPLKHMAKDLRLAVDLGGQHVQILPMAETAQDFYEKALEQGLGNDDFSAIYRTLTE